MKAFHILQDYLDRVGQAVMDEDYEVYADQVSLPFRLITEITTLVISTQAELESGFEAFAEMMQSQKVTDYIRLVDSAVQLDEDLISGRYVTHILSNGNRVMPAFCSQIVIRREDGKRWRAASIANSMKNARWPILLPRVGDEA